MANYGLEITSGVADGGVAHIVDTDVAFTSGTLLAVKNNASTKVAVDFEGSVTCHDAAIGGALTVAETTVITGNLTGANAAGPAVYNEAATATNPTLIPDKADPDTGVGWQAADALSLVAGGVEAVRMTETGGAIAVTTPGSVAATLGFNGSIGGVTPAAGAFTKVVTSTVTTLDDTGTPTVAAGNLFITGGTTAITDFDDGVVGQTIRILAAHSVTITDGAPIILAGGANFAMVATDTLTLTMFNDQVWVEVSRSVN